MNLLGPVIKRLRKENGWTQEDLMKRMPARDKKAYKQNTISGHENGKSTIDEIDIHNYATAFGIKPADLFLMSMGNVAPVNNMVNIPILGEIACGDPILTDQNIVDFYRRDREGLPSGELFVLEAKGQSMEPAIQDKAKVLCRLQSDVENGEVAAVLVNGDAEATLKRVRKVSDMIILEPLNDDFEPYVITKDNPGRIIGKALEVYTTLNF